MSVRAAVQRGQSAIAEVLSTILTGAQGRARAQSVNNTHVIRYT